MKKSSIALAASCVAVLAGCVGAPRPPEVQVGAFARTLVFPVVDIRENKNSIFQTLSIATCTPDRPSINLLSAHSLVDYAADKGLAQDITRQDLEQRYVEKLKQLPSGGDHYIALIFLDEFVDFYRYKLTSFIVRADTHQVIWKHTISSKNFLGIPTAGGDGFTPCHRFTSLMQETFINLPQLQVY